MAFESFAGNFSINTATGNQSIIGVGFLPKIVIFYGSFTTADGVAVDAMIPVGAALSSSDRFAVMTTSEDGQGTTDTRGVVKTDKCLSLFEAGSSATIEYEADFVSLDVDGFTINVTTAPGVAYRIGYLALGGDTLTNVYLGDYQMGTSTGNEVVTGVGFEPDAIMLFANGIASATTANTSDMNISIGYATSPTKQGTAAIFSQEWVGTSVTYRYQVSDKMLAGFSGGAFIHYELDLVSFDADGFTYDLTNAPTSGRNFKYICLQGGEYDVGVFNSQTSTGTFSISGLGFTPQAGVFTSVLGATSAIEELNNKLNIGLATGNAEQFTIGSTDEDNQSPSNSDNFSDDSRVYLNYDFAQTKLGDISLTSWDADGFTLDQMDADPIANEVIYFVIGSPYIPPVIGGVAFSINAVGVVGVQCAWSQVVIRDGVNNVQTFSPFASHSWSIDKMYATEYTVLEANRGQPVVLITNDIYDMNTQKTYNDVIMESIVGNQEGHKMVNVQISFRVNVT